MEQVQADPSKPSLIRNNNFIAPLIKGEKVWIIFHGSKDKKREEEEQV